MKAVPIAIGALALAVAVGVFLAYRGPNPDAVPSSQEVQHRVMSPFCDGVLLADCTSSESAELRKRIESHIQKGWTNRQIDEWLVDEYGTKVLARPLGILPWAIPVAALLAGATAIGLISLRRNAHVAPTAPNSQTDATEYRGRIHAEMQALSRGETE
jgi:cytochrome c-type biogenesis protein CcmH/NrfF